MLKFHRALMMSALLIAQPAAADSSPISKEEPRLEQISDWVVRCVERAGLPPCEVVQTVQAKDSTTHLLQFSAAYAGTGDRYAVQLMLPLGVFTQGEVAVRLDDKLDIAGYTITRCETQGCFSDRLTTRKDLEPLLAAKTGIVAVRKTNGPPIVLPLSFKGFPEAIKLMVSRNEAWAKTASIQSN